MPLNWYIVAALLVVIIVLAVIRTVQAQEEEWEATHRRQQDALRRHHKAMAKDRKKAEAYWRERGQVIKPLNRYCASLDENEEVS